MSKNDQRPTPQPQRDRLQKEEKRNDRVQEGYKTPQERDEHWQPPAKDPNKQ
jgi:hypothetical protein